MSKNKKQKTDRLFKEILKDIQRTLYELRLKDLLRDENGVTNKEVSQNIFEISFDGKTDANSVMLDKHVSASFVMNKLLCERQFTALLYDKAIIQAEFTIENDEITKERLVFLKKHNRIWNKLEIAEADAGDEDWFSDDDSIPVFLRIDFDKYNHTECHHPIAHFTLANYESCRIPMQDALTFSEFIRFVLHHFYNINLDLPTYRLQKECSITMQEKQMIHIGWN